MKHVLAAAAFLLLAAPAQAKQVSLLEEKIRPPEPVPVVERKEPDPEFEKMKEFMRQEDERIKSIKILNLDLERADLELKKRDIEAKLGGRAPAGKNMRVSGIFLAGQTHEALIDGEAGPLFVQEGHTINGDVLVKKVELNGVTFQYPDGKNEKIKFDL